MADILVTSNTVLIVLIDLICSYPEAGVAHADLHMSEVGSQPSEDETLTGLLS
jgi:hypothetical protein